MKNFISLTDLPNFDAALELAKSLKEDPYAFENHAKRKTLGLIFFNPSLRTRLSTQKAAQNLGFETLVMNFSNEAWALEFEDGTEMRGIRSEHVREAAAVISQYCDVVAIRAFASLNNKEQDEAEIVLNSFANYASIPVINMESATGHPLQALADALTLAEHKTLHKPKVVLSWAPHPKALPHAVGNSFVKMMEHQDAEFVITNPEGYDLDPRITKDIPVIHNQEEALKNADFVYAKNWCSYSNYGSILRTDDEWMLTADKMKLTNNAKFMHCLPVRRNIVVADGVLDNSNSLVIEQANNRTYAAQAVLKTIIDHV
ncbi:N-acetylornithine carbamoyltransferase [Flavobacteriaceae bacterium]|uniref:N-acetylornithine carbamoyltransferase n=1 Tax=Candidatus Arcticimaribacter forsetii TaxID=2820661 RepID=UPI0020778053|nr:N-acetylornithine carbamoyltransferase [Candidatus Arcticimaribacter forsetii]MDA8698980.1 N-acetylornithine carbamoyltransferase [Flavobacteriaceae bacterium]MDB2329374.1 N-acetylornithine carbamoyltransferase [Flavobacteriaceae bacterium]MDB2345602.1 N-acetylornithine carbamoyltransferase [Flavobacteriaceae bacterium]MDB4621089.1 N-acetylornithine carbamoyltransferase [Flavobacteriaceae bacterium]MDB4715253.1 N-acetylornithine carbamoyltransferase [Flavobacteriaceae bacterium]